MNRAILAARASASAPLDPRLTWELRLRGGRLFLVAAGAALLAWLFMPFGSEPITIFGIRWPYHGEMFVATALGVVMIPLLIWRLGRDNGPVLTISPHGFEDTRWMRGMVAWDAVASITPTSVHGARNLVVKFAAGAQVQDKLPLSTRLVRPVNAFLGIDGYLLPISYLSEDREKVEALIMHHFEESRGRGIVRRLRSAG